MRTSIIKNSSKSLTFISIFMVNTSTQIPSLKESEMFTSTEDQEPFLRDSKYLTGQQLRNQRDGNLISTPEELGTMLSTISDQNGHQLLSQEKD